MENAIASRPLLSEVLRPQTLSELNQPDELVHSLEKCVLSRSIPNMLFYGEPGIGKTSAARILLREMDADVMELNGSFHEGDKSFVRRIEGFAYTASLFNRPKVCFIDEADFMSRAVQDSLRYIIENASDNTRFLLTANDEAKLTSAMKSRCIPICFDVKRKDADSVIERMVRRYQERLIDEGYDIERDKIRRLVEVHFPDLRSIANQLQLYIC
jgi:replication factor C small subunit